MIIIDDGDDDNDADDDYNYDTILSACHKSKVFSLNYISQENT